MACPVRTGPGVYGKWTDIRTECAGQRSSLPPAVTCVGPTPAAAGVGDAVDRDGGGPVEVPATARRFEAVRAERERETPVVSAVHPVGHDDLEEGGVAVAPARVVDAVKATPFDVGSLQSPIERGPAAHIVAPRRRSAAVCCRSNGFVIRGWQAATARVISRATASLPRRSEQREGSARSSSKESHGHVARTAGGMGRRCGTPTSAFPSSAGCCIRIPARITRGYARPRGVRRRALPNGDGHDD